MKISDPRRIAARVPGALALAGLLVVAGCQRVDVAMSLEPGGGGRRTITVEVDDDRDGDRSAIEDVVALFGLEEEVGWRRVRDETRSGADEKPRAVRFRRAREVRDLAGWAAASGDLEVRASLAGGELDRVRLRNTITVERGETAHGHTFTYREILAWNELREVIVGYMAAEVVRALEAGGPGLGAADAAELRGLLAGHLLGGWDLLTGEGDDPFATMVEAMAADLLPQVVRILRRSDPSTDPVHVRERLVGALSSDDDRFDRFLERELPGVDATVLTSLEVSLRMPGRLVETNADEREDGVVRWELDLSEAIRGPIEIYARSEVDGR